MQKRKAQQAKKEIQCKSSLVKIFEYFYLQRFLWEIWPFNLFLCWKTFVFKKLVRRQPWVEGAKDGTVHFVFYSFRMSGGEIGATTRDDIKQKRLLYFFGWRDMLL
ncbi:hypothetical protein MarSH_384 [Marseillevirus Shanghai 1]|nr:hypothetical protein MarSH_384 [Marseillevirus Shanghai 1]